MAHFLPDVPFLSDIWRTDQSVQDLLRREGRKTVTRPDFVFIGIDQESLEFQPFNAEQVANNRALQLMAAKPFPWSREVWALVLDRLFNAGARLVMFDLIFSSQNEGDPAFRAALDRYRDKVVLGANVEFSKLGEQGEGPKIVPPSASLIDEPRMLDGRVGYVVFFPDALDEKIRSLRYTITELQLSLQPPFPGEPAFEALSARAAEKLGHSNDVPRDLNPHMLRFSDPEAYQPKKLWEILDDKIWHFNFHDGQVFKDKVIVIGSSAQVQHDVFNTPMSPETPGPVLHLYALAAALAHEFVYIAPLSVGFATIIGGGILSWVVVAFIRRPLLCFVTLLALTGAYLGAVRIIYDQLGYLVLVIPPLSVFLVSGLSGLGYEYTLERIEKIRTRRTLERYVSKNIVKEILDNPGGFYSSMLGSRKAVTVLFSDLVGFTSLSEKADPAALVSQLNRYLSAMVPMVFDNGGTLDKFIGDAIMAVWGNVSSHGVAEDAKAAVRAAHGMRQVMAKLNEEWRAEGIDPLAFGVGINHGEAVVGNIGSYEPHERLDPTVIGDAVNLASRLEALTRTYRVDILIGQSAAELVRDEFHLRSVARVQVKGKSQPVDVFTLVGARTDAVDPEFLKWLETYEEAIVKFRKRDFKDAKILFSHFLEFYPDDALGKMYLATALEYEQSPPDEAWNAVEVFKKK
ncbi:MAG TPA: adenylate/guanylate cyclase domain-containing protein [Chthoniobacterales bacterium]|nr:adenylate/guanylate cyclase domain-containing protein [Chthoniobacterales bacterium]